jgi:putative transposase
MDLEQPIRHEILNRIKLLKIFDQDGITTEKIKENAQKNNITYQTLYRWKKKYDQYGWVGLIPNYDNRGRKRGTNDELEEIMRKVIEEKYLTNLQPSVLACYRFLEIECEKNGIENPSPNTFRARIKEISNIKKISMRKGKKLSREKFNSLDGEYPFGEHPLDLVEFDHTILDIMLIDRFDRNPIGRPTLTIGIDVYSRMVYGYYLSFDAPNILAIGMCFLNAPKRSNYHQF